MTYDFTTLEPVWGSGAPMWEMLARQGAADPEVIMFGVAEMKFPLAPAIRKAVAEAAEKGFFGYCMPPESMKEAVCGWFDRRHGWKISPEDTIQTYGVVPAIGYAVDALTEPGEGVLVMYPCYSPFERTVNSHDRNLVRSLLRLEGERWTMDLEDIREKTKAPDVKVVILCNPHNPTGRSWSRQELMALGEICLENDLWVISDEIHCDLVYKPHVHTVFASLSPELAARTITLTAPSKTFNIAGMTVSNVIIPQPELRRRFAAAADRNMGHYINGFGFAACTAAYNQGEAWLEEVLEVLSGNAAYFRQRMAEAFPAAKVFPLEATYLQWADFSCFGALEEARERFLTEKAKFFCDMGSHYGPEYTNYQRINLACPRQYIKAALDRLEQAMQQQEERK